MNLPVNSTPSHALMEIAPAPGHEASHAVPAADAAALSLVFLLVFCVVCFALGAAILGRRERKATVQDPNEVADDTEPANNGRQEKSRADRPQWERESGWWKR
jgi:hypothetical protein